MSLERLQRAVKAPPAEGRGTPASPPMDTEYHHRWDMSKCSHYLKSKESSANFLFHFFTVTLSTAKGITDYAPESTKQKETFKAVAVDVDYVITHIAKNRQGRAKDAATLTR